MPISTFTYDKAASQMPKHTYVLMQVRCTYEKRYE